MVLFVGLLYQLFAVGFHRISFNLTQQATISEGRYTFLFKIASVNLIISTMFCFIYVVTLFI